MVRQPLKKVCIVTASELTLKFFLIPHIKQLEEIYDVFVVVNTSNKNLLEDLQLNATLHPVSIERKIKLVADIKALWALIVFFRVQKFDLVHSMAPKAGLLTMLAGYLTRIPNRIHTFTGQVWVTKKGYKRWLLKSIDKIISLCATHLLVDSFSQRDFLIEQGVTVPQKSRVLEQGSVCGVDTNRFSPNAHMRSVLRTSLGMTPSDIVLLFIGRINRDKGILDLFQAFEKKGSQVKNLHLLIVGPDEENLIPEILHRSAASSLSKQIHYVSYTETPEKYMAASDILCLPSYREGFGNVIIEAASVGLPALASKIYGITDAVIDGKTGLLHQAGNIQDIHEKMSALIADQKLFSSLSQKAYSRAREKFSQARVLGALKRFYQGLQ